MRGGITARGAADSRRSAGHGGQSVSRALEWRGAFEWPCAHPLLLRLGHRSGRAVGGCAVKCSRCPPVVVTRSCQHAAPPAAPTAAWVSCRCLCCRHSDTVMHYIDYIGITHVSYK